MQHHCWYSARQRTVYTFGKGTLNDPSGMLSTILANDWTTGELLFQNAAACSVIRSICNDWESVDLRTDGPKIIASILIYNCFPLSKGIG